MHTLFIQGENRNVETLLFSDRLVGLDARRSLRDSPGAEHRTTRHENNLRHSSNLSFRPHKCLKGDSNSQPIDGDNPARASSLLHTPQ